MKKNNHVEKRISFLEKVYQEDRERWKATDRLFRHVLVRQAEHDRRFEEIGRRLDKQGRRQDEMQQSIGSMQQSIGSMQQSINSQLKILRRMMER